MAAGLSGTGDEPEEVGVAGEAAQGAGVQGLSHAPFHPGVLGVNDNESELRAHSLSIRHYFCSTNLSVHLIH